jgi:hypothetical protein
MTKDDQEQIIPEKLPENTYNNTNIYCIVRVQYTVLPDRLYVQ